MFQDRRKIWGKGGFVPQSPYNFVWYLNSYSSNFIDLSPLDLIMSQQTSCSKLKCPVHENFSLQFSVQTYKNFMEVFKSSCKSWKTFQPNQMTLPILQCKVKFEKGGIIQAKSDLLRHFKNESGTHNYLNTSSVLHEKIITNKQDLSKSLIKKLMKIRIS